MCHISFSEAFHVAIGLMGDKAFFLVIFGVLMGIIAGFGAKAKSRYIFPALALLLLVAAIGLLSEKYSGPILSTTQPDVVVILFVLTIAITFTAMYITKWLWPANWRFSWDK